MNTVFLDTSFLLAASLHSDQYHEIAAEYWRQLETEKVSFLTTSYIFDETVTFLNSRGKHSKAVQVGEKLLTGVEVTLIHVDVRLFDRAWADFRRYDDKRYSLTDCVSFLVMTDYGVARAAAFDNDFVRAGFVREPTDRPKG